MTVPRLKSALYLISDVAALLFAAVFTLSLTFTAMDRVHTLPFRIFGLCLASGGLYLTVRGVLNLWNRVIGTRSPRNTPEKPTIAL
ncbi:MAG: hypothetical protein JWP74_3497 [Marmoricola sp.]|nr:hypothetical protein [Marmoricola sp.]